MTGENVIGTANPQIPILVSNAKYADWYAIKVETIWIKRTRNG